MGIVIVLMLWCVALTIAAFIAAIALGTTCFILTRNAGRLRKTSTLISVIFPFACVAFAAGWFIVYATINYEVFKRDPGLGDSWETPLPNGYALMMIDTTDQGTVYNPQTQSGHDSVSSRDDAVFGVRQLQVSKALIFGARDTGYFGRIGEDSKFVDAFFELDTNRKTHLEFKTLSDLQKHAATQGVTLNLREFISVFSDYRTTWFDWAAGAILLLIPAIGFFTLARWVWKVRRDSQPLLSAGL